MLEGEGCAVVLYQPGSSGEARDIAGDVIAGGVDCVVIAGGDGSVSDVLDLVAGTESALAVLPQGRGNDFVRGMGLPRSCSDLAHSIVQEQIRVVDLGCANGKLFGTVASLGLDAEVGRLAAKGSSLGGMSYLVQAFKSLRSYRGYPMRVTIDGDLMADGEMTLVACANTSTYGGGFCVAPGASPEDGRLDVCVVRRVSRLQALGLMAQLAVGEHAGHTDISMFSASEVVIESSDPLIGLADGEVVQGMPLVVSLKQDALRLVY
jgi:YegS/Rv2252/BmrU family lipid kinase